MFHLSTNIIRSPITREAVKCVNLQSVRWGRKPSWKPIAKTKMFKIPPRKQCPPEEVEEMKRLYNNYRTYMKSITKYMQSKYDVSLQASADPEQQKKVFEEDFAICNEINEKWNAEQKVQREKYGAEALQKEIELAKEHIALEEQKEKLKMDLIEEIVRNEKEASKTFITPDKLDAAIEHALANSVDYNFAIDLNGNKIIGRETIPEETPKKLSVKQ